MSMTIEEAQEVLSQKIEMLDGARKVARRNGNEAEAALLDRKLTIHYGVRMALGRKTMQITDLPPQMFVPWQPGQHASASMEPHHRELLDRIIAEHPVYSQRATTTDPAPTLKLVQPPSKPEPAMNWREQAQADWDSNANGCRDQYRSFHAYSGLCRTRAQAQPVTPPDDEPVATADDTEDVLHDTIVADWEADRDKCRTTFKNLYAYRAYRVSKRA